MTSKGSFYSQGIPGSQEIQANYDCFNGQYVTNNPPELNGSNATLLDQYYANINYHIENVPSTQMSAVRNDLCKRVKRKTIFQTKVFGKTSYNFDVLPENAYSSFTVSLYLILNENTFTFYPSNPGFEITDSFEESGSYILGFISNGLLPPSMLDDIRKLNLVWYDGGLICEVNDRRKKNERIFRTLLRVSQSDIAKLGTDVESEYLLARYPLLCFDADIQISKVARVAERDRLRWMKDEAPETAKNYVQEHYPSIFLEPKKEKEVPEKKETPEEATKLILDQLSKLTKK